MPVAKPGVREPRPAQTTELLHLLILLPPYALWVVYIDFSKDESYSPNLRIRYSEKLVRYSLVVHRRVIGAGEEKLSPIHREFIGLCQSIGWKRVVRKRCKRQP